MDNLREDVMNLQLQWETVQDILHRMFIENWPSIMVLVILVWMFALADDYLYQRVQSWKQRKED